MEGGREGGREGGTTCTCTYEITGVMYNEMYIYICTVHVFVGSCLATEILKAHILKWLRRSWGG